MKRAHHIEYCKPWAHGRSWQGLRFVENVHDGLRFVNYADEVARDAGHWRSISHKGWYTDDTQHSTVRGVVFRLGRGYFVPGYVSSDEEERNGRFASCVLAFNDTTTDAMRAANLADQLAESIAESEREYDEAWRAGMAYESEKADIREHWQTLKQIMRERKSARDIERGYPALHDAITRRANELCRCITEAREECKRLFDSYGKHEAFNEGKLS